MKCRESMFKTSNVWWESPRALGYLTVSQPLKSYELIAQFLIPWIWPYVFFQSPDSHATFLSALMAEPPLCFGCHIDGGSDCAHSTQWLLYHKAFVQSKPPVSETLSCALKLCSENKPALEMHHQNPPSKLFMRSTWGLMLAMAGTSSWSSRVCFRNQF